MVKIQYNVSGLASAAFNKRKPNDKKYFIDNELHIQQNSINLTCTGQGMC